MILTKVVIEPWIGEKILTSLNNKPGDYLLKIEKVHVLIFQSGIELENITLIPKQEYEGQTNLTGEIETVTFKGIHLIKAFFRNEIDIRGAVIFNSRLTGNIEFPKKAKLLKVSPVNIRIENLLFDKLFFDVKNTTTAQAYSVKDGVLKLHEINIEKQDTLSPDIFGQLDFEAMELKTVTPDSLYTISAVGINYSATSNILKAIRFVVQPNYTEYEFSSRNQFQKDRIEADIGGIIFHNFSIADYIKSGSLISSYIEIGEMELNVFRDKRKKFRHVERPTFQNMIYNYPGAMNIDSIGILNGNIVYSEHAEKAIEKGNVSFNKISARIYKITNDTIYEKEKAYLILNVNALLMGKSKISVLLKARIFDSQNTFSVNGTLSEMEASKLNPFLEKNAFITVTTGKINAINFSFSANNTKAIGNFKILYEGLNFAVVDKQTGDTTAIKEQLKSIIANIVVINSNPMPGKEIMPGVIEYDRDPERFLFNYCFKAILSGIKSSIGLS
ncbi:hypothetical protein [Labilibaculum sp. K2S]|uniref:hypothetical protein n=1 Tax=Labilibaculum sp. K2S TaxID=3056386 RepID=UPI0025A40B0D|nr:hypothetical protein [Labilibaculum sp. K2S]